MKRKASSAFKEEKETVGGDPRRTSQHLDDYFIAEEILPRLPAHAAQAFAAASTTIRRIILTGTDYWLSRAPPPHPRAACLVVRSRVDREFHYADASFSADPTVANGDDLVNGCRYAGTCNGLVLLTSPWDQTKRGRGVLFNPVTGIEQTIDLDLTMPGARSSKPKADDDVYRCFCGLGYSPSNKTYKALVCERDFSRPRQGCPSKVEAVPFTAAATAGGQQQQQPGSRTVATLPNNMPSKFISFFSSLSIANKVYVLFLPVLSSAPVLLEFDADDDSVHLAMLPRRGWYVSRLMELWGRPCVATGITGRKVLGSR